MMIRSSSTPILGSLLSSSSTPHPFNESPINHHNHHHHHNTLDKTSSLPSSSFPHHHPPKPSSFSCHLSPISSDSAANQDPPPLGFRRASSDGNLHRLLPSDYRNTNPSALDTIPSFSERQEQDYHEEDEEEDDQFDEEGKDLIERGISRGCSYMGKNQNQNLVGDSQDNGSLGLPLFLARGLGIDRVGSGLLTAGGSGGFGAGDGNGNGGESSDIEKYYKRMVEENPSSALFLSNYAQFLYQSKGDAKRAEEYYSRAILAEPGDGEILSQYAKLVWELHHDKERASSYFEQAVRAAPSDSRVLGAYASFLWEADGDDGDGGEEGQFPNYFEAPVHHEIFA